MECPSGEINPYQKVSQVLIYIVTLFILVVIEYWLVVAVNASTFLFNNQQSSSLFFGYL